jgi:hypothetical protein
MNLPRFTAALSLTQSSGYRQIKARAIHIRSENSVYLSARGQDFPGTTCTCKGCASGGGDLTGQCSSVCKDKTVYSKGSEPYDYCKAAARVSQPWWGNIGSVSTGTFSGFLKASL